MRYQLADLKRVHSDSTFRSALAKLYAIRQFFRKGIRVENFTVPQSVEESIVLSEVGERLLTEVTPRFQLSQPKMKFVIFLLFYHDELLVDLERTGFDSLKKFLDEAVALRSVRFPWVFEHALYDKAFELFPDRPGQLNPVQTEALLANTPTGVFQIDTVLTGPFGVLVSKEQRLLPPTLDLLLWHCDDPMCGAVHVGTLSQSDEEMTAVYRTIRNELKRHSAASPWGGFATRVIAEHAWYDDFSWINLPWLLGNAFTAGELRSVVAEIIDTRDKSVRAHLPPKLTGSGKTIAACLTKPEAMQVVLIAKDEDIVAAVDGLVEAGTIKIPTSEVRKSYPAQFQPSWLGAATCECSALGLRVVPARGEMQVARLRRLVENVYQGEAESLRWRLRGFKGFSLGEPIEKYISETDPVTVLRDLIFVSPENLRKSFEHLRAPHLRIPAAVVEDDELIRKLLWKLGFPQSRFDSTLRSLYESLKEFRAAANVEVKNTEQWRSLVRGAGANVFVALEEVLDLALGFSAWLLLSDPIQEKHLYNHKRARQVMATELSGVLSTPQGAVELDAEGRNTLFPLIAGFQALAKRVESLLSDADSYEKPRVQLAHYSRETTLQIFPYRHRHFALDLAQDEVTQCIEAFNHIATKFQDTSVLNVRNRIDHRSETFPAPEEIDRCYETLQVGVSRLEALGLFPSIYATSSIQEDLDGRTIVTSVDYAEASFQWSPSPMVRVVASLPTIKQPQIIVKCLHVPGTNEPVRFRIETDSEYTLVWADYPKRRQPTKGDIADADAEVAIPSSAGLD